MLISLCVPIMNRLDDLKETMPYLLAISGDAESHWPVEIVIADYNSTDGLAEYVHELRSTILRYWTYFRYTGRDTYHAAHANNLAMLAGHGEYVVLTPADVFLEAGYIYDLCDRIKEGCVWCNTSRKHRSVIAIQKDEFIAAGGYDECFEMYGPDDIDLIERLGRRGCKHGVIQDQLIRSIYTSPDKKVANYRIKASHKELGQMSMSCLEENRKNGSLTANDGVIWG